MPAYSTYKSWFKTLTMSFIKKEGFKPLTDKIENEASALFTSFGQTMSKTGLNNLTENEQCKRFVPQ